MTYDVDMRHLCRRVDLAAEALEAGDEPFGSVLVEADGTVLGEDHNRVAAGDHTRHPEFALARRAAEHMTPAQRASASVYTSGAHCPMGAAAHGWVGLGRIVHVASGRQLAEWLTEWGVAPALVAALPVTTVVPDATVEGPVPELVDRERELHRRLHVRP